MDNIYIEQALSIAIREGISIGCAQTMQELGVTSGELSERQVVKTYGRWIKEAIQNGKVSPCRVGEGTHGTRYYSVVDILAYKAKLAVKATLR